MPRPYRPAATTDKPADAMTPEEARAEYDAIRKRWGADTSSAERRAFNAKIALLLTSARVVPASAPPGAWVIAARGYRETCGKCRGSGEYTWGPVVNGIPSHRGTCYACEGAGKVNDADRRRCWGYWNHYARVA